MVDVATSIIYIKQFILIIWELAEIDLDNKIVLLVFLVPCTKLQIRPGFKQMSGPEAKQGTPVRTDSCFLSATLSQCTFLVIEDLCRVVPVVSWAPVQYVPVVWQMCSP